MFYHKSNKQHQCESSNIKEIVSECFLSCVYEIIAGILYDRGKEVANALSEEEGVGQN